MINPKIIYIVVVLVFCFIVYKFKIVPYLAARKILKDAKKNGKGGSGKSEIETATTAAQLSGGGYIGSVISPSQLVAAMQSMQSAFPAGMVAAPSSGDGKSRCEMFFDYETIDTRPESLEDSDAPYDPVKDCELLGGRVNALLFRLRNRGIVPDTLGILPIADGVFIAYVIYTV